MGKGSEHIGYHDIDVEAEVGPTTNGNFLVRRYILNLYGRLEGQDENSAC